MSARAQALATAIEARLGPRAARHAPAILIALMVDGYCLFRLDEIPQDHRDGGILVRVAAELEQAGDAAGFVEAWNRDDDVEHMVDVIDQTLTRRTPQ